MLLAAVCGWVPLAMEPTLNTNVANSNTQDAPARETLLREVRYRLSYRATLELDFICRAALPHTEAMSDTALLTLRDFLLLREGLLMDWLVDGKPAPEQYATLVNQLKVWLQDSRAKN